MPAYEYDVIVVGGGPGGYVAAVRARQLGLKTALIEKEHIGGTCVNWGCIPTKSLLFNAEVAHLVTQQRTFGLRGEISADYGAAHSRSRQVAKRQGKRVEILLKNRGVDILRGAGRLNGEHSVAVEPEGREISAAHIILATGAEPRVIPGMEFDGKRILSAKDALVLEHCTRSVVIIGAGPIGLEFATVWARYGAAVTVVEMLPRILPQEEAEIGREAEEHFRKAGVRLLSGAKVTQAETVPDGVAVTVDCGGKTEVITAENVLVAAGFVPRVDGLGVAELGIAVERGRIIVDEQMRSSVPHIYAIGDVNGKLGLAHAASAQGVLAAESAAGHPGVPLVYENIPRCIFGVIEIASVGLTERQAQERGYDVASALSPFAPNGKALGLNSNNGFVKLVADQQTGRLLGAHMAGPHVTELIAGQAAMIALGATVKQMAQVVYAHPTLSEAVMEAIHALAGCAIHIG